MLNLADTISRLALEAKRGLGMQRIANSARPVAIFTEGNADAVPATSLTRANPRNDV
jgi:hypothetical protein